VARFACSWPLASGRREIVELLELPERFGAFAPQKHAHPTFHVDDVAAARAALEAQGVVFAGDTFDSGVCQTAIFTDPDGNDLMPHRRYAPHA
jgi:hypothetical protein